MKCPLWHWRKKSIGLFSRTDGLKSQKVPDVFAKFGSFSQSNLHSVEYKSKILRLKIFKI